MQNQIPNTERLDDLHPARFLRASDLLERWKVQSLTVTISRYTREETIPNPKDIDPSTNKPKVIMQPVLYFISKDGSEFPRGYLVSAKADVEALKQATKAETVGETIGKQIKIIVGEHRKKEVLRIDPTPTEK